MAERRHTVEFDLPEHRNTQQFWDTLTDLILRAGGTNIESRED